jgi:hypothetical protein
MVLHGPLVRPGFRRSPSKSLRRALAAAMLVAIGALASDVLAQESSPAGADKTCELALDAMNRGLAERRVEAYLSAARFHESGYCVVRSDAKAAEYLGFAARAGSALGARRLARKYERGEGVPQSYASAGAWLTGKGASEEPLAPWDYSIGYAHAVLGEVLATTRLPVGAFRPGVEAAFVVEVDALRARQVNLRPTAQDEVAQRALYQALATAFNARVPDALKRLAPPDPKFLVRASVTVPMAVRLNDKNSLDVLEDEPILR